MTEREQMRHWVQNWKTLGPILDEMRREEIRTADNRTTLALLESAFNHAITLRVRETSGMVEMQAVFAKLRR